MGIQIDDWIKQICSHFSVFGKHNNNPLTYASPYAEKIEWLANSIGLHEVTPRLFLEAQSWLVNTLCSPDAPICRWVSVRVPLNYLFHDFTNYIG